MAGLTAYYANRMGKNPLLWFVISLLLGIFSPLILFLFSSIKPKEGGRQTPSMTASNPDLSAPNLSQSSKNEVNFPSDFSSEEKRVWYYLDQEHQQVGPVSLSVLRNRWKCGELKLSSYVWSEGMKEWEKVENLPELYPSELKKER